MSPQSVVFCLSAVVIVCGIILIGFQLWGEVMWMSRVGSSYVGIVVLGIGAALAAVAFIGDRLPKSPAA